MGQGLMQAFPRGCADIKVGSLTLIDSEHTLAKSDADVFKETCIRGVCLPGWDSVSTQASCRNGRRNTNSQGESVNRVALEMSGVEKLL